ncbi:1-acyl-sn-glycerol-3-phosphate acyltransferase [Streptomyces sp. NPDC006879]|uniref:1-acyl-sn-glycerol-3-phosphate acyltransferase n=1 Tax=Streptomyces sp. NPDC006879 TaxID=3364767 RepID=UPI00369CAF04
MSPVDQGIGPLLPEPGIPPPANAIRAAPEQVPVRLARTMRAFCGAVVLVGCLLLALCLLPVLLVIRVLVPWLPRQLRGVARLVLLFGVYLLTCEVAAVAGSLRRRLPAGRAVRPARWGGPTGLLFGPGLRAIGMRLSCPDPPRLDPSRPVVVLLRHAGLLNMQLGMYLARHVLRRRPHGVCKAAAVFLPGAAALVRSSAVIPLRWNRAGRARAMRELAAMGPRLAGGDAAVVLPEGTNFSLRRRRARTAHLRRRGRRDLVVAAESMPHVLPPLTQGTAALLTATPNAQVLVVGHTGLEDVLPWRLGRDYPPGQAADLRLVWWSFEAHALPHDPQHLEAWLYERWRDIDAWVLRTRTP